MSETLSAFPYYGGKAKMASFICSLIDYKHTDTFVTPFGGACRVLLNKPHHSLEYYGDLNVGLCKFFELMSKKDTAHKLIHHIYQTEYSQDEFNRAVSKCYIADHTPLERATDEFKSSIRKLIEKYEIASFRSADVRMLLSSSLLESYDLKKFANAERNILFALNSKLTKEEMQELHNITMRVNLFRTNNGNSHENDIEYLNLSDLDLATATYVKYAQSRDAMGKVWSATKFQSQDQYYRQMKRLYRVAERLNGVHTFHTDANFFYSDYPAKYLHWDYNWISQPNVMMVCDPPYISPDSETAYLTWLSKFKNGEIDEKQLSRHRPKDLGTPYTNSFTYEDHEAFLQYICHARCRLVVSNYGLKLYDKYLTPKNGWRHIEYETTTSVGGKKDNKRTEVLWVNY